MERFNNKFKKQYANNINRIKDINYINNNKENNILNNKMENINKNNYKIRNNIVNNQKIGNDNYIKLDELKNNFNNFGKIIK
jgi:hypothetical protein